MYISKEINKALKIVVVFLMIAVLILIVWLSIGDRFKKLNYDQRISLGIKNCQKLDLKHTAEQLVCRVDSNGKTAISDVRDLKFGDLIVMIINTPVILNKSELSVLTPTNNGMTTIKFNNDSSLCVLISDFNFEEGKFFIQPNNLKDYMLRDKGYDYVCHDLATLKKSPIIFGGMLSYNSIANPNAILASLYLPSDIKATSANSLDFFNNQQNYGMIYYFVYKIKR